MTIPLGALCSTGCIVEDVRHALFRGQATNSHIRVHPEQPQGEDAFGYAFTDILNNCAEPKQYDVAGKKHLLEAGSNMGTGVKNTSADGPSHTLTTSRGLQSTLKAKDKAVLSNVFDECWPRDTQTGFPYPQKKTHRFPIAAPPYIERICYASFNYRAGYTADNNVYAKETVIAAIREKQGNVRNYLARHYFQDEGKDGQGGRKKGPLPSADGLAKAFDLAEAWHQSEEGRYYQAGKCPPRDVMFKGEEEVCEKRAGGILEHNTNAVKILAATQAVPGDNVDEGSSPEPPAKKATQPAKPAAGGLVRGWGGAGARAGGGALGSRAGRQAAVAAAAAATREQQTGRRGGPGQNRM
eukprot:jgi/Tetstr1/446514/TSEL_034041.t1